MALYCEYKKGRNYSKNKLRTYKLSKFQLNTPNYVLAHAV